MNPPVVPPLPPPPFNPGVVVGLAISALIAIGLPVVLAALVRRRTAAPWRYLFLGAATFVVSQIFLRLPWLIPLNFWVAKRYADRPDVLAAFGVFAAITAGLFEETGRYVAFKKFAPEKSLRTGLMVGVGHGGIESIVLVGLQLVGAIVTYVLFTRGALPAPPDQLQTIAAEMYKLTPLGSLAGGVERIGAIAAHVGMSLIVLRAVVDRRPALFWLSVAVHTVVGLIGVFLLRRLGIWPTEALIVLAGGAILWLGLRLWRGQPARSP